MIDITNKQSIYDAFTDANNNKQRYKVAADIVQAHKQYIAQQKKEEGLNPLSPGATDDEIRARAKVVLINKLNNESITAAEFAQFKDIFNLASKTDDLRVEVVDYKNAIIDCPHCGDNVHKPTVEAL